MNLFGEKKKAPRPDINGTIVKLQQAITMLVKRKNHVEKQIEVLDSEARLFMKQNKKEHAIQSIKKKKMLEKSIQHVDNQLFNLEAQKVSIEQINSSIEVIETMKQANEVLQQSEINANMVSEIMDDLQDNIALQEEISAELARPLYDISVDDELKELEEQIALDTYNPPIILPFVPNTILIKEQKIKEKKELEDELGLNDHKNILLP